MKRHRKNNLLPTYVISSVLKITPRLCKELGIEAMLLDIDNTLTTHNNPEPYIGLFRWIDRLQDAGVELIIFSNNNHRRVANFARRLDLPYVARAAKPLPFMIRKTMDRYRLSRESTVIVGDQLFTDILGANLANIYSVLVTTITPEHGWFFRLKRKWEKKILDAARKEIL
ncbi:MAG: YqeG family HAD IIIA-type phosphatase [Oscillospiraceae bacterium]|jgi:hypothetical protein|nr:YqeG family HAD IIIA-type phosphatase [Oscillospiraceae bacterium]